MTCCTSGRAWGSGPGQTRVTRSNSSRTSTAMATTDRASLHGPDPAGALRSAIAGSSNGSSRYRPGWAVRRRSARRHKASPGHRPAPIQNCVDMAQASGWPPCVNPDWAEARAEGQRSANSSPPADGPANPGRHDAELGFDVLSNIDPVAPGTNLQEMRRQLGGRICLCGGVNSTHVLEQGSAEDVERAMREAVETLGPGSGFILAPGDSVGFVAGTDPVRARRNVEARVAAWHRLCLDGRG
ncbi:MAG: uroporphyrinogen decarboxylase family protein [Candidatus Latescibacterota bacterium]